MPQITKILQSQKIYEKFIFIPAANTPNSGNWKTLGAFFLTLTSFSSYKPGLLRKRACNKSIFTLLEIIDKKIRYFLKNPLSFFCVNN